MSAYITATDREAQKKLRVAGLRTDANFLSLVNFANRRLQCDRVHSNDKKTSFIMNEWNISARQPFSSRSSMIERDLAIGGASVCPSVFHTLVMRQNQ